MLGFISFKSDMWPFFSVDAFASVHVKLLPKLATIVANHGHLKITADSVQ